MAANGDQRGLDTFKHVGGCSGLPLKRERGSPRQVSHHGIARVSGLFRKRARFA